MGRKDGTKPTAVSRQHLYVPALSSPPFCSFCQEREAGSALEMGRLEAPVRDKPGIDQHQRRAVHQDVREIGSNIKKLQRRRAVTRYEAPLESLWAVTESGALRNP